LLAAAVAFLSSPHSLSAADSSLPAAWYRGIVHAHANWGVPQLPTTAPDVVVRWYREHNYNFVSAHPNLTYALTAADLLASDKTAEPRFFEVWNTEPGMNNLGGGGKPSTEQIWDAVLSTGRVMFGTAVDDSHHFYEFVASRETRTPLSNPGRAWIMVRAQELSVPALIAAMNRGDFYASTGVTIESYDVTTTGIRIRLNDSTHDLGWSLPGANPQLYRTEFIGKDGKVVKVDESVTPSYDFTGKELYVRARITSSDAQMAWTQPVFPK